MELLLDARRDEADHALVPVLVEQADRVRRLDRAGIELRQRVELHVALDVAPLAVELVELPRQFQRALEAVGRQALDADRHVGQSPGRVDAGADREAEVHGAGRPRVLAGDLEQRRHPGMQSPVADPLQPLRDENPVVAVEPHDVCDRAERDEVEQRVEPRLRGRREAPAGAQFRAQRQQNVEHHADARQVLARKAAARLVRIDDARGVRQHRPGQVMVGDEHGDAEFVGPRHAVDTGDAVVDGDDQVGRPLRGEFDDFRRQPVAVLESIRDEVVDVRAHCPQAAQPDRAGGRAVAVVVGDDQQPRVGLDRIGEQERGLAHMRQRGRRHQPVDQQLKVVGARDPARGQHARQRGQHTLGDEAPRRVEVGIADE